MSDIPKRKPLPPAPLQDPRTSSRPSAAVQSPLVAGLDTDARSNEYEVAKATTDSNTSNFKHDRLIVKRATLEQMTYLLLDLIGTLPQDYSELPQSGNARAKAAELLASSSVLGTETVRAPQDFTSQEVLKPEVRQRGEASRQLLQRKPWCNERVITLEVTEVTTQNGSGDAQEEEEEDDDDVVLPDADVQSIPLRTSRQPRNFYQLQEDSLYNLAGNHPWTDLHTHLGPAQFTEEGQEYWLGVQGTREWPAVLPPERRDKYVAELWRAMTVQSPDPDPMRMIMSDLAKDNTFSLAYKQVIARKFPRAFSSKNAERSGRRKRRHPSRNIPRWQALYRNVVNTNDTARARLPSTSYLRIVGQGLFRNSLPRDGSYKADTSIRILIACLCLIAEQSASKQKDLDTSGDTQAPTVPPAVAAFFDGSITIWDLLVACYRSRIMEQPPPESEESLRGHTAQLLSSLQLVNSFTSHPDNQFLHSITIDELLSSSVGSICSRANLRRREPTYPGTVEYFGKKELNIQTLQDVGALNILWTRYIDDHLTLDTQFAELRVFWPAWALANLPCTRLFAPSPDSLVFDHLLATYGFLFYSPGGFYDAVSEYNKLDPPSWLSSMNVSLSQLTKGRPLIGDPKYHLGNAAQPQFTGENTSLMRFDNCGIFENRVRVLKAFMDMQKPSGLRALWRDKRDSGQWYTFWLVSILGGISIVLALASLAVSIAQTVASFQALNIQPGHTNSSSQNSSHQNATRHNFKAVALLS